MDDSGFGAAARMAIDLYDRAARGSGRTRRMIMAMPEGVDVLCKGNPRYLIDMTYQLRGVEFAKTIRFVTVENYRRAVEHRMRHRDRTIVMDHELVRALYLEQLAEFGKALEGFDIHEPAFSRATDEPPPVASFDTRGL